MHRVPFFATVLAMGGVVFVLGSAQFHVSAQSGTPSATSGSFVGAWRLTFDTPQGPSQSLLTIMADGTVLFSGRPVKPAAGGIPVTFISAAHGVWQPAGPTTAETTWVGFVSDGEGNFLAIATDSARMILATDGTAWRGPYSATVTDPDGSVLFVGGGTVEATRITVQPLATPTGETPVAQLH